MQSAQGAEANQGSQFLSIIMLVAMFFALYFLMIRPQKNQEKSDAAMRETLQIGDEIVTAGGIMGRVVTLRDDSIVIETGADRIKIRVTRTSIITNITASEKMIANKQAALDAAKAKKIADKENKNNKK
ncbi:MAG: preprotein translocase subunit YajC [Clostridiales bacterium]|nr:preprotein translocase subunit YajC [Clostridiales bacterium]